MVPISERSRNDFAPERSLKDSLLSWARAALITAPLVGCVATPDGSLRDDPGIVFKDRENPERRFEPPLGFVLTGLDYHDGALSPIFSPAIADLPPLSEKEISLLRALVSPNSAFRFCALVDLRDCYLPNLEPAIIHILLNERDDELVGRASRLLKEKATEAALEILCREITLVRGVDLERSLDILREHPGDMVIQAVFRAIRTSGFGEKEGRDEGMSLGKTLVSMSPMGEHLVRGLLTDPEPTMQMAAAVSLATRRDEGALPILLRFSTGDDVSLRREALTALSAYPQRPEVLVPLAQALKEPDFAFGALYALKDIGYPALAVLEPYASVEFFKASGIERQGRNPYLPGLSYGEIVVAICRAHELRPPLAVIDGEAILKRITETGIRKLIDDLDHDQLRPGASEGFLALGARAHPYLAGLLPRGNARQLLLSYPTEILATEFTTFLEPSNLSLLSRDACAILAQSVRRPSNTGARQSALEIVLKTYPEAPWLRHLVSSVWREDCDYEWTRAALRTVEPAPAVCAIATEVDAAIDLGINVPLRWSRENLGEIIRNRTALDFDGRPIATMVYAEADYNGAFGEHNPTVELLRKSGYCVMYYDESTDLGVIRALKEAVTRKNSTTIEPAALIILGAHSTKTEMVFGRSLEEPARISMTDKSLFADAAVRETLRDQGQIVLIACSAGEGREKEKNIANLFRELFPHAKQKGIWTTEVPDNIGGFSLDPASNELLDVRFFRGRVYRP